MASTTTSRNLAIDWIKGWMILCIILHHTWMIPDFRGYLAVDVFFYISGFYLMKSFLRKPTPAVQYTWKRIKQIAAPYFICIILGGGIMLARHIAAKDSFDSIVDITGKVFATIPFAGEFGGEFTRAPFLLLYWYLSALIICSFILYAMLQYSEHLSVTILFPAIILLGYNALFGDAPSLNTINRIGLLGAPLIRGLSEMAAGAMICHIYSNYRSGIENRSTLVNVLGFISLFIFVALLFTHEALDKYTIVTIPWFLLAAVMDHSWLNAVLGKIKGGFFAWVGRYTLYIYCIHGPVQTRVHSLNDHLLHGSLSGVSLLFVDFVAIAAASVALYYLCRYITRLINTRENQSDHTRL